MQTNTFGVAEVPQVSTILVVHQSAELYGSDRSLLDLLGGLDRSRFVPIVCVPEHGPLIDKLQAFGIEVHVAPLLKVRRRTMLEPWRVLKIPGAVRRAMEVITQLVGGRKVNLVYTNTLAVMAGAIWASCNKIPHVWHVREIINRPPIVSFCFRRLVATLADRIICNSNETLQWVASGQSTSAVTVWNGIESLADTVHLPALRASARSRLNLPSNVPVILVVGRINARKGQDLVLDAIEMIQPEHKAPFHLLFVGGVVHGETAPLDALKAKIAKSIHASQISVHPFTDQVADYYLASNILVLPSRHPESFGRVAIEAMSFGLPVIAAAHGGALEIVEEGETGLFFTPSSAQALASKLLTLLKDAELRERMGEAGRNRQRRLFSIGAYVEQMHSELLAALERTD